MNEYIHTPIKPGRYRFTRCNKLDQNNSEIKCHGKTPIFYIHTNFLYGTCTHFWWRYIKLCQHIRYLNIAKNLVDGKEMYFWYRYIKLCQHISYLHIVRNILYSTYMEFW